MTNFRYCLLLLAFLLTPVLVQAQSVSFGADFVSRYIWRGFDFGESFSVQPALALSSGGFEIGSWASYSIAADGSFANEHDLYVSYSKETESAGSFGFGITDYYFPAPEADGFFNYSGDGEGSHWIEPYVSYDAPGSFPISLYASVMVHNDPDNSLYVEASLPFDIGETAMGLTLGMAAGESDFYAVESASLINVALSAEREIAISESFSLPVFGSYVMNPTHERTFLVFGFSLSI